MTIPASKPLLVPASKTKALNALTSPPLIAWPSVAALAMVLLGVGGSSWLALSGAIPLWAACLASAFFLTWEFTAIHESLHRSLSSNVQLNDWLGRIGILVLLPYCPLEVFRWYHARHHRFTNAANDPDQWTHGPAWQLPLRWMSIDLFYLYCYVRRDHQEQIGRKLLPRVLAHVGATLAAVVALSYLGYGREVLFLWFLPTRLAFLYMGGVFFWLPHCGVMENYTQQQDPTLATSMRLGNEALLNPGLQFHNYHLIHHLYPSTPSYRHPAVWRLLEDEIRACGMAINHGYSFQATIHSAELEANHA